MTLHLTSIETDRAEIEQLGHYPLVMTIKVQEAKGGPWAGQTMDVTLNADRSLTIENHDMLHWCRDNLRPADEGWGIVSLVCAARHLLVAKPREHARFVATAYGRRLGASLSEGDG